MIISKISNPIATKGLKPISEYKGPILKLNVKEKKQILEINKKIANLELELQKLKELNSKTKTITPQKDFYNDAMHNLTNLIDELRNAIKEIKIQRLNKQKAKLAKKNLAENT